MQIGTPRRRSASEGCEGPGPRDVPRVCVVELTRSRWGTRSLENTQRHSSVIHKSHVSISRRADQHEVPHPRSGVRREPDEAGDSEGGHGTDDPGDRYARRSKPVTEKANPV